MNPNLPVTADEIAADVRRCHDAGAVLFHVHARDADQKPTLDINVYKENARRIKDLAPDVIVQLSTGARAGKDWEDRAKPVRLLPEMGSFTTGSNNLPGIVYENSPQFIEYLAKAYQETGVKPEIEVFETGMIANALFLQKKGYIKPPLHFDFVLGAPGSMPGTIKNLQFLSESIPPRLNMVRGWYRQGGNSAFCGGDCHGRACPGGVGGQPLPPGRVARLKSPAG